jgi:hypothetical protein
MHRLKGYFDLTLPMRLKHEVDIRNFRQTLETVGGELAVVEGQIWELNRDQQKTGMELTEASRKEEEFKAKLRDLDEQNFRKLSLFEEMLCRDNARLVDQLRPVSATFNTVPAKDYARALKNGLGANLHEAIHCFKASLPSGKNAPLLSMRRLRPLLDQLHFLNKEEMDRFSRNCAPKDTWHGRAECIKAATSTANVFGSAAATKSTQPRRQQVPAARLASETAPRNAMRGQLTAGPQSRSTAGTGAHLRS